MSVSEFDIIRRYFDRQTPARPDILKGIGDDAALLIPPVNYDLTVAIDTLVEGIHFPVTTSAYDIGWKALAVNLSDMAAMGADPSWFTLALTLPEPSEDWLVEFSRGLFDLADQYSVSLVGGDTTRGPLTVSIQIGGYVPHQQALMRNGARPGDKIYVTNTFGDAALALKVIQQTVDMPVTEFPDLLARLNRPQPRVREGQALRTVASCAIDVSDGLLADLNHLLAASSCGAKVNIDTIPVSTTAQRLLERYPAWQKYVANGGDDYELCFCVPPENAAHLQQVVAQEEFRVTCIGQIEETEGLRCIDAEENPVKIESDGYRHFGEGDE